MKREELLARADILLCRGNAPVIIDDPGRVYWVLEGEVEIFLLPDQGERSPWLRLGEAGWIFGRSPEATGRLAAYATSSEGARVAVLPVELVEKGGELFLDGLPPLLEQYGRHFGGLAPKNTTSLRPGLKANLLFESNHYNAESGILWVLSSGANLRLAGDSQEPLTSWIPLTRSIWVDATERTPVDTLDQPAMAAQGGWAAGLRRLQFNSYGAALEQFLVRQRALKEAISWRQQTNERALSAGLAQLAAILPGSQVERLEFGEEESLAALCRQLQRLFGCPFPTNLDPGLPKPQALARAARCRWRAVVLRERWWQADAGPMLVVKDNAFGTVFRRGNRYWYRPGSGAAPQVVTAALAAQMSPQAFVFYRPFPREHLGLTRLVWLCLGLARREVLILLGLSLVSALLALLVPFATGLLIGTVLPSGLESELGQLILALLVASLAGNLFGIVKSLTQLRLEGILDAHLQASLFDRLLELPAPFFRNYSLGDLANRALGFNSVRQALSGAALTSLLGALFSVFSLALLFYYSFQLAWVALVIALIQTALLVFGGLLQMRYQRLQLKLAGQLAGDVAQFLSGIAKLRVAGAEARAFAQWSDVFASYRQSVYRLRITNLWLTSWQGLLGLLGQAVLLGFTAHFGFTKSLSAASLMSFFSAFGQFTSGLSSLTSSLNTLLGIGPTMERARPILETVPEVEPNMPTAAPLRGLVEIKEAWFRFDTQDNWVLQGVSIQARPGEFVAVVGPSGAGKSTLLRLLLGFEGAQRGSVLYDGQNLLQVDRVSLRRQLGVVLQDARLMPGDLFTNIVGSSTLTEEDAWQALRLAGLEEEVRAMPMQLHTVVTDGGGGLSGGQRQRLMIARAVVSRPRVLIFDEATSALDAKTQEEVSQSLANLQATRIVVAHRLSTIRQADRIYVLHNHKVEQVGTFDELANTPGFFAEFARRQLA
ncbi:MAG: NHLP bacteriocin export ABC transporter permease/ATPase subunit [Candidatus Eremiobacteraeota bacterium]|nr:NHLP bacteriocin export ABC transporter permease/ATPase subunit [Candidatus Eremiobacteraeota bacterium]MCW5867074.1 NHLP bacteriocin export ABC transporter permease/ATPase subunit [Candidatus Eremiobacteraeota bacterium]